MISDEQIRWIMQLVDAQIKANGEPNFVEISRKIFKKYYERYEPFMLNRLWEAEKDNPKWRKPNYLDLRGV